MKFSRSEKSEDKVNDGAIRRELQTGYVSTELLQNPAVQALLATAFPALIIFENKSLALNPAAAKSFFVQSSEPLHSGSSVFGRHWKNLERYIRKAFSGDSVQCRKFSYYGKTFQLSLSPVKDTEGKLTAVAIIAYDTSPRNQARRALKESEERFRQLADFMPQLVWTASADGTLEYCNRQWMDYTGLELSATGPYEGPGMHPDDVEYTRSTWSNALKSEEAYEIAYRFKDLNEPGEYRWFLGRAFPVKDRFNKVIRWFGTCTDIHENKTIAEELERRVKERTQVLNEAYNSLKRSNQELEQFAYVASHDLQEPLRKIKTFASRIIERSNENMDELSRSYLDKLMNSADRMSTLISDVLNYSMLNQLEQKFEATDLNEMLKQAIHDYELSISRKGAVLKLGKLPVIEAISYQMNQLFHNLISNALKFSKADEQPCIEIYAEPLKQNEAEALGLDMHLSYQRIAVRDNGIGFSEGYREKIFEIFQRLHPRQLYSGTGIGLALCRKIAELHKGCIYAHSEENIGTTFFIVLPEEQHAKFHYQAPDALYFQAAGMY